MKYIRNFFSENFQLFLVVKVSVHLNRHVFVMDYAEEQADLNLRWSHKSNCKFCHALAQILIQIVW